eukprot:GHVP01058045.1.p1 GENE.GHVP01058045.1~~GHVP01058045.1.p1  ORF type:complete len:275 (+),score=55.99 GHVP01058045.1:81-905(+)
MGEIIVLEEEVVRRISAGEVVVRPGNAVKEILENSLDSGATSIDIETDGISYIQIEDNGCGIKPEDLPLVCHRHATSKIKKIGDLSGVGTFGFRGEALASISTVSSVTILTKRKELPYGHSAEYNDTVMSNKPVKKQRRDGTTVLVRDLFYNSRERKLALRSASEEYIMILNIVQKYSYANPGISFSCKRKGKTPDLTIEKSNTVEERINIVYGPSLGKNLIQTTILNLSDPEIEADGYISNVSFRNRTPLFIFFLNDRLVDIDSLKKNNIVGL